MYQPTSDYFYQQRMNVICVVYKDLLKKIVLTSLSLLVGFDYQLDRIWNHHGNKSLSMKEGLAQLG